MRSWGVAADATRTEKVVMGGFRWVLHQTKWVHWVRAKLNPSERVCRLVVKAEISENRSIAVWPDGLTP